MKILVVSLHYYPENFLITDICEGLVERGHEVTVVTGLPNYPKGIIYEGYEKGKRREEVIKGVRVHRCNVVPRKKGVLYRLLNYYSFAHASTKYVKGLKEEFDVVFSYQLSPVMQAKAGLAYQKKWQTPCVLYCLDLWPESLAVGKVKKSSWLYRHYFKVAKRIYTKANKILVTSYPFVQRLENNFHLSQDSIGYLPQHAKDELSPSTCQKTPDGYCDLLFAGNVGLAQSVETIIRAAAILREDRRFRFHIVGDGTALPSVKKLAQELGTDNVAFYGRQPMEKMTDFYQKADGLMIAFNKEEVSTLTLPAKMQSYMAAGKPILCSSDGAAEREIRLADCGYTSTAEDVEGFVEICLRFADDKDKERLGKNARAHYEKHFTREKFLDGLIACFQERKGKKDENIAD